MLKKTEIIKRRIAGLTSYYGYQDESQYPKLVGINKEQIPMSDYQFGIYERYRHQEIEKDKFNRRQDNPDDEQQSTYRIYSRLACSLVFPEEIGNPYDSKTVEDDLKLLENLEDKYKNLIIADAAAQITDFWPME